MLCAAKYLGSSLSASPASLFYLSLPPFLPLIPPSSSHPFLPSFLFFFFLQSMWKIIFYYYGWDCFFTFTWWDTLWIHEIRKRRWLFRYRPLGYRNDWDNWELGFYDISSVKTNMSFCFLFKMLFFYWILTRFQEISGWPFLDNLLLQTS